MKKALVLVLALVLTMGLAVPAAAAGTASPKAPTTSETTTAPLPEVTTSEVKAEDGTVVVVETIEATDTAKLAEEEKTELAAAQTALAEAAPAGMKAQYFFFVKVTAKDDATKEVGPVAMTVKVDNAANVVVMQFVDGKWVELKTTVNADGTITIEGVVTAPMAIFTK